MDLSITPKVEITQIDYILQTVAQINEKINALVITDVEGTLIAVDYRKELLSCTKEVEEKRTTMVKPLNDLVGQINDRAKEIKAPIQNALDILDKKIKDYQAEQDRIAQERKREEQVRIDAERKAREEEERKIREDQDKKRKEEEAKIAEQKRIADERMAEANKATDEAEKIRLESEAKIAEERRQLEQDKSDFEERKRKDEENAMMKAEQEQKDKEELELANAEASEKVKGMKARRVFAIEDENEVPNEYKIVNEKKIRESIKAGIRNIKGVKIFQEKGF